MSRQSGSTNLTLFTGLIVLSAEDGPGLAQGLFETLAPFAITILDVEQIVIGGRLILTVLIDLNPAHADAIEADIEQCSQHLGADIAIAFSDSSKAEPKDQEPISVIAIGDPLTPTMIADLTGQFSSLGVNILNISTRSGLINSVTFNISGASLSVLRTSLSSFCAEREYEVVVQTENFEMSRKLFVMDVDSTLIQQEVIELLAKRAGVEAEVRAVTESAMRGELDFAHSLAQRVALLKGLPESVFTEVGSEIVLTAGAELLIKSLQQLGHSVALVTGGFIEVVAPLAHQLGIALVRANSLEVHDGHLTGLTQGTVLDRAGKAQALKEFAEIESIPLANTVAIGDGANDLDMLAAAGLGIAFNAKPAVRAAADSSINKPDLARILDLLAIPRSE
ncbi:MAG: phosphoserine phosphatase SerB [Actinobacteria bacterium]|nr:phosphoserine phosphatase SerB [Actinomycetota bacterium]